MLEESATVVEASSHTLWVETESRSACSHCSSSNCNTSVVSKLFGIRKNRLKLENSLGAKQGERVVIGIPDKLLVRASVWAYLLPLICMLASAWLGGAYGASDGYQSLLALGGLAVGFTILRWTTRNLSSQQRFEPRLLRISGGGRVQVEIPNLMRS